MAKRKNTTEPAQASAVTVGYEAQLWHDGDPPQANTSVAWDGAA